MLKLENLTKKFNQITAVDQVSFEAKEGEVIGFLGPNGAGKSTTMRLISGYLSPTAGQIYIKDKNIKDHEAWAKQQIGYLPEGNPLYKELKALEMLELTAELKNIKLSDDDLKKIIKETGLESVLARPVGELSKGFRQRVGLACALLGEPKILVLDEPTEGLDPNQRGEIRRLIKQLGKNRTVLISTHIMEEVEAICQRVIIIHQGKIVSDSDIGQLGQKAEGQITLSLTIDRAADLSRIRQIGGVREGTQKEEQENKKMLTINASSQTPIQPPLTELAGHNGWTIWELTEKKISLEEVFKELTK